MLEFEDDFDEVNGVKRKRTNEKSIMGKPLKTKEFEVICLIIDTDFANNGFGKRVLSSLQNHSIPYRIQKQKIPFAISLTRKVQNASAKLDHMLVLWTLEKFLLLHASKKLLNGIEEVVKSSASYKLTLLIMENNLRSTRTEVDDLPRTDVDIKESSSQSSRKGCHSKLTKKNKLQLETTLTELQLNLNVQYRFVKTTEELEDLIIRYSKAFAELPSKLERNKKQECVTWFATADSKDSVRVDADGNGLFRLWEQQLHQFTNVGFDIAQAIALKYSSPQSLMNAYDVCVTQEDAKMLLRDIPVRRTHGPLNSTRRVGPEISKKVFTFFNNF